MNVSTDLITIEQMEKATWIENTGTGSFKYLQLSKTFWLLALAWKTYLSLIMSPLCWHSCGALETELKVR